MQEPAISNIPFPHPQSLDYQSLFREGKRLAATPFEGDGPRIALFSDAATQQTAAVLRALFSRAGHPAALYEAPFGEIELEILDDNSGIHRFKPGVVIVLNATQALRSRYHLRGTGGAAFAADVIERARALSDLLRARLGVLTVISNYVVPYDRYYGHLDGKIVDSFSNTVTAVNQGLQQLASETTDVFLLDINAIASYTGTSAWFDERLWFSARAPCSLEHLPVLAQHLVNVVLAARGRCIKCFVVDLDNTLWGGVVGDDGLEGIQIGPQGEGEAYRHFQHYLLELRKRGILLAVCSKNDPDTARAPFREHPEMLLREHHFSAFIANWDNKADNIVEIARTLNIGLDLLVFVDDNPYERSLVRERLPQVTVPELPEEPADYVRVLSEYGLLESISTSVEDYRRADLYTQEDARRTYRAEFKDIQGYLRSLQMRIRVERFDDFHLSRITQLFQRSSQFNLTTRRRSSLECDGMKNDPAWGPFFVSLEDKFGDYGVIGIVVLHYDTNRIEIADWLMSCRVLSRGVEEFMMNFVVDMARSRGIPEICGTYLETSKNRMVREFYPQFGFEPVAGPAAGRWTLDVGAYASRQVYFADALSSQGSDITRGELIGV